MKLKNPIVLASSGISKTLEQVQTAEEAGVSAVVLKSLFEEQIYHEYVDKATAGQPGSTHAESYDYIEQFSMALGPEEYLNLISNTKKKVGIPVIASLNCTTSGRWIDYAQKIEDAKADALELNLALINTDAYVTAEEIEEKILTVVESVTDKLDIPVCVKIGPNYTSIPRFVKRLTEAGAKGVVLFNRFYELDIDINKQELSSGMRFSSPQELSQSLRWISILSGRAELDLIGSRGIHDSKAIIKLLLAGANAVQICSAFYIHKLNYASKLLIELEKWMQKHSYKKIEDFRGKLSQVNYSEPEKFQRLQYIKAQVGIE